jgi:hypothetical protein
MEIDEASSDPCDDKIKSFYLTSKKLETLPATLIF